MFVERVIRALDRAKVRYALVGGYAVALHGAVRGTVDIDLVIVLKRQQFEALEKAMTNLGLQSILPVTAREVFDYREEYIRNRNLVAWSFSNPSNPLEMVDILITEDLDSIKTETKQIGKLRIEIAAIPDLISMKLKSNRPQDKEDIKALEKLL